MKIKSFSFKSDNQNWHIEEVHFEQLNLLVGVSGVGKTRILRALDLICDVARGKKRNLNGVNWSINFSHLGKDYKWDLKASDSNEETFSSDIGKNDILYERLVKYEDQNEPTEVLERTRTESRFNNDKIPKLKRTESAITILAEEDSIAPVAEAFKRFIFNETPQQVFVSIPFDPNNLSIHSLYSEVVDIDDLGIKKFKENSVDTPTIFKAYLLQKFFPKIFDEIREVYVDIFPSVNDVRITVDRKSASQYSLLFEIEEHGLKDWISQNRISSGMYRTFTYLIEILAAPEESVVVIDEFENSLGINCMPQLTNFILDKSDLQFILTSHHPYIINNIPWQTWQLVSRSNGTIRSRKAVDIPTLNTASSLDKFTQLINLLEHEEETA